MQKLIIKETFLGVKPCEIEFDRFLLLIGEQASGKSTIAKLIYFFQTIPDIIYKRITTHDKYDNKYLLTEDIDASVIHNFYLTFGSPKNINILFEFNNSVKIELIVKNSNFKKFDFTMKDAINSLINKYKSFSTNFLDENNNLLITELKNIRNQINSLFSIDTTQNTYLIAGRNNVVAYSEYFENKINYDNEKILEEEVKGQDLHKRLRRGNEKLLVEFIKWSSDIRKFFQIFGGSFENIRFDLENKQSLRTFEKIFSKILKAEYKHDSNGELLKINDKESVYMKDASSGQQEVLRILQGLYLSVGLKNRKEFFVVEEPEAHLYPLAQKELINAFALFLNTIKEGRLIITTHSPYILACVNILLYANFVSKEVATAQKEIENAVSKDFWLDSKMFNAYSLGHEEIYCQNIKDDETGLIDQNYLDAISEQLGLQYHQLYNLLAENYA